MTGQVIDIDGTKVALVPSARSKRLALKVDGREGAARLTYPIDYPVADAIRFAKSKSEWIKAKLGDSVLGQPFTDGALIPFRGEDYRLVHCPGGRGIALDGNDILVAGELEFFARRVGDWLKREAGSDMSERSLDKASRVRRKISRITIRDTKSRWGSCSSKGALNYSWRLILTPDWVRDYMAAHEVAHLVHMNHSPAFWAQCAELTDLAPVAQSERYLKTAAKRLFSYGRD